MRERKFLTSAEAKKNKTSICNTLCQDSEVGETSDQTTKGPRFECRIWQNVSLEFFAFISSKLQFPSLSITPFKYSVWSHSSNHFPYIPRCDLPSRGDDSGPLWKMGLSTSAEMTRTSLLHISNWRALNKPLHTVTLKHKPKLRMHAEINLVESSARNNSCQVSQFGRSIGLDNQSMVTASYRGHGRGRHAGGPGPFRFFHQISFSLFRSREVNSQPLCETISSRCIHILI